MSWPVWLMPKRYQIGALVVLALVAVTRQPTVLIGLLATVATTVTVDLGLTSIRKRTWFVPEAAIISGLIISLVLLPAPIIWPVLAGFIAMVGKQLFSFKGPILNPATAGMVTAVILTFFLGRELHLGWLGDSLPLLTLLLGLLNAHRNRKWAQVISFLAGYVMLVSLVTGESFLLTAEGLLGFPWFFTLYMLTEPRTSPTTTRDQLIFGLIVALFGISFSYLRPIGEFSLLLGLLLANSYATLRRLT